MDGCECPKCGNDEEYIKEHYSGVGHYYFDLNTGEGTYANMGYFEGATYKIKVKYVRCSNCDEKLMTLDEYNKKFNK